MRTGVAPVARSGGSPGPTPNVLDCTNVLVRGPNRRGSRTTSVRIASRHRSRMGETIVPPGPHGVRTLLALRAKPPAPPGDMRRSSASDATRPGVDHVPRCRRWSMERIGSAPPCGPVWRPSRGPAGPRAQPRMFLIARMCWFVDPTVADRAPRRSGSHPDIDPAWARRSSHPVRTGCGPYRFAPRSKPPAPPGDMRRSSGSDATRPGDDRVPRCRRWSRYASACSPAEPGNMCRSSDSDATRPGDDHVPRCRRSSRDASACPPAEPGAWIVTRPPSPRIPSSS